jgi:hypothetical protein
LLDGEVVQTTAPSHQCVQHNQVWKQKARGISVWEERAIRRLALAIALPFTPLEPLRRSELGVLLRSRLAQENNQPITPRRQPPLQPAPSLPQVELGIVVERQAWNALKMLPVARDKNQIVAKSG